MKKSWLNKLKTTRSICVNLPTITKLQILGFIQKEKDVSILINLHPFSKI